jgi:hypothetical protein
MKLLCVSKVKVSFSTMPPVAMRQILELSAVAMEQQKKTGKGPGVLLLTSRI